MCADNLESSIVGIKLLPNRKGNKSSEITSEIISSSWSQFPVLTLVDLLKTSLIQLGT